MRIKDIFDKIVLERWTNGIHLDDDQILGLTTSDYGGQQRYYYNKVVGKFIPVLLMGDYNIDDFDCGKEHVEPAKKIAITQDLDPGIVKLGKVRAKMSKQNK